jgi:hypothetical protein
MRCIHAPCAILCALHAPIILTEFLSILHYRIFSLASVFIHIPLTSYQLPLNQPSMRNLRVCLTYNFAPCTLTIVSNFAFSLQSCIFRIFSYRADFILATPLYNYSFWTWHLFHLDPLSIRRIHILFAPNFAPPYPYLANVSTDNLSILACMEDIIILAHKCANALASRAPPHHAVEHISTPRIASPSCTFNLQCNIEEFIPLVSSPPAEL